MQISIFNFNSEMNKVSNMKFIDTVFQKDKIDNTFENILEDKMDSMNEARKVLTDKNIDNTKENKVNTFEDIEKKNDEIKAGELNETKEDKNTELHAIKELFIEIEKLLSELKDNNSQLFKDLKKELCSIKKQLLDSLKGKESKDLQLISSLRKYVNDIKKVLSKRNENMIKDVNSSVKKETLIEENDNKDSKEFNSAKDNKRSKKNIKALNIKNIEITDTVKNKKPDVINKGIKVNNISDNFNLKNMDNSALEIKESSSLRKADIQEIINKVTNKIKINVSQNKSEVVMNLKPEFLGKVTIKMEFKGKSLSAKFIVDNVYAEKMFKDNMTQLKVNFQEMGLQVENFDISLNNRRGSNQSFEDFHMDQENQDFFTSQAEEEWTPIEMENYDSLGWIAQNVNMMI